MTRWAILATGPSMSQAIADAVRDKFRVIVVSDAYRLAPWAEALVSYDRAWWAHHKDAKDFQGRKFSRHASGDIEAFFEPGMQLGCNSGLMAMFVAIKMGAKKGDEIYLFGFDMGGSHFFGAHPEPLKNTKQQRFQVHIGQFKYFPKGYQVFNMSPNSALKRFPFADIDSILKA